MQAMLTAEKSALDVSKVWGGCSDDCWDLCRCHQRRLIGRLPLLLLLTPFPLPSSSAFPPWQMAPLGDRILVKPQEVEKQTAGGILLAPTPGGGRNMQDALVGTGGWGERVPALPARSCNCICIRMLAGTWWHRAHAVQWHPLLHHTTPARLAPASKTCLPAHPASMQCWLWARMLMWAWQPATACCSASTAAQVGGCRPALMRHGLSGMLRLAFRAGSRQAGVQHVQAAVRGCAAAGLNLNSACYPRPPARLPTLQMWRCRMARCALWRRRASWQSCRKERKKGGGHSSSTHSCGSGTASAAAVCSGQHLLSAARAAG